MEILDTLTQLIFNFGLTLGAGSSTFALTFYFLALNDGIIDTSEKRFMHTVYFVLRIGMISLAISLLLSLITQSLGMGVQYVLLWGLLIIITVNAILMTAHMMPMKYGPVIAGGSWYSLFFINTLPIYTLSLSTILVLYAGFLVCLYVALKIIGYYVLPKHT